MLRTQIDHNSSVEESDSSDQYKPKTNQSLNNQIELDTNNQVDSIQSSMQNAYDETNDEADDEAELSAFCSDNNFLFNVCNENNNNSNSRRYYINRLYQPLNNNINSNSNSSNTNETTGNIDSINCSNEQSNSDCDPTGILFDDDFLLCQELKFLESTAQLNSPLLDEREQVEIGKILEDDEDADGENMGRVKDHHDNINGYECLQLDTIVGEDFDNPLNELPILTGHEEILISNRSDDHHTKPDSTDMEITQTNESHDNSYNPQEILHSQDTLITNHNLVNSSEIQPSYYQETLIRRDSPLIENSEAAHIINCPTMKPQNASHMEVEAETTDNKTTSNTKRKITTQSRGKPKRGRLNGGGQQSSPAEESSKSTADSVSSTILVESGNKSDSDDRDRSSSRLEDSMDEMDTEDQSDEIEGSNGLPQLSKYRRRTANARERIRMREINRAFERLKKVVPIELIDKSIVKDNQKNRDHKEHQDKSSRTNKSSSNETSQNNERVKLTKITTLRLAVSYITKLSQILEEHSSNDANVVMTSNNSNASASSRPRNTKLALDGEKRQRKRKAIRSDMKTQPSDDVNSTTKDSKPSFETIKTKVAEKSASLMPQLIPNIQIRPPIANVQLSTNNFMTPNTNQVLNQPQQDSTTTTSSTIQCIQSGKTQQQIPTTYQQPQRLNQNPQTITISATPNNIAPTNLDHSNTQTTGAFVTPVAVAILGTIQTNGNGQHQLRPHMHQPQIQALNGGPVYNLITTAGQTTQSQPVTLTLDDLNGLSVLRFAHQPTNGIQQGGESNIRIQQAPTTVFNSQHQQAQFISSTNTLSNYSANYSTTSVTPTTYRRPQQTATIHIQAQPIKQNHQLSSPNQSQFCQPVQLIRQATQHNPSGLSIANNNHNNTGNGICFNTNTLQFHSQHLNSNSSDQAINGQPGDQQQINGRTTMNLNQDCETQLITVKNHHDTNFVESPASSRQQNHPTRANIIYIQPQNSALTCNPGDAISVVTSMDAMKNDNINQIRTPNPSPPSLQFEQVKFVSLFQSNPQSQSYQQHQTNVQQGKHLSSEASIKQLVASLTTDINQNDATNGVSKRDGQQQQQQQQQSHNQKSICSQQQQQQMKRTYRFHNYDGSMMINNHLYQQHSSISSNSVVSNQRQRASNSQQHQQQQLADQQQKQQNGATKSTQIIAGTGQRSRQNSLSSNCSTTSSSSSFGQNSPSSSMGSTNVSQTSSPMVPSSLNACYIVERSLTADELSGSSQDQPLVANQQP